MNPFAAAGITTAALAAAITLTRLTARGYERLLAAALERRDQLITRALETDPDQPAGHPDLIDREYRLLTEHHPDGHGHCAADGTDWPCIPAQLLGTHTGTETT